jgi:NADH-quinone oxidoreductase subunit H
VSETVRSLVTIAGVLLSILTLAGLLIWVERRLLALWQDRLGPNRLGPLGLGQVVADVIKIISKEDWVPPFADKPLFILAPAVIMTTTLLSFAVVAFTPSIAVVHLDIGLLFFLGMSSLGVYSVVIAGWSSNSKYPLLGSMRAAAQMFGYEIFMGLSLMGVVMQARSFDLRTIVLAQHALWNCIPQCIGLAIFFIAGLAEARRLPFDLPEAENELVAGYHTEYSGMKFGMFFVGEYVGILLISSFITMLFFGGWQGPLLPPMAWFAIKTLLIVALFILSRAALSRPRYDQLIAFGWKFLLPLSILNLFITGATLLLGDR